MGTCVAEQQYDPMWVEHFLTQMLYYDPEFRNKPKNELKAIVQFGKKYPEVFVKGAMWEKVSMLLNSDLVLCEVGKGQDFTDESDNKTSTLTYDLNGKGDDRWLTRVDCKGKIGTIRLAVIFPPTKKVDYFLIPFKSHQQKKLGLTYKPNGQLVDGSFFKPFKVSLNEVVANI